MAKSLGQLGTVARPVSALMLERVINCDKHQWPGRRPGPFLYHQRQRYRVAAAGQPNDQRLVGVPHEAQVQARTYGGR